MLCVTSFTRQTMKLFWERQPPLLLGNSKENTQKPRFSVYRQSRSEPEPLWDYYGAQLWSRGCGAT